MIIAPDPPPPALAGADADNAELGALLQRCAARDRSALQALYARVAPQLLGCIQRILRRRDLAEDALQDVFIRIWQQAGQFDQHRGRALAWLVTIARYRAIDLQRAQRPMLLIDQDPLPDDERLQTPSSAEDVEFAVTGTTLQRCLAALGNRQRRCLELAYQQGLTQDQIALTIGEPLGTVKSWVRRGLQALRRCMET